MSIKGAIVGSVITLFIGGTAYTVSQTDVVNNFAKDTGLSQQQAQEYVDNVKESDLVSYDELGKTYTDDGQSIVKMANDIDCAGYTYEWESDTLTCSDGQYQLRLIGNTEISVGESYIKLGSSQASKADIQITIDLLSQLNAAYNSKIAHAALSQADITDSMQTNSYNKSLLQAALQSDQ